jgi:four helix bundle protein
MTYAFPFEKLEVWKKAKILSVEIYRFTASFPEEEKFGIVSQMRRAAVSVASNIAEGASRLSKKDQAHFYQIAYGSLAELLCQVIIASDLSYLSSDGLSCLRCGMEEISRMLNSLKNSRMS